MRVVVASLLVALAGTACGLVEPPGSCDFEVTVSDRDFDVECDYDDDEGEYDCSCEGNQVPESQEPPSCEEQCADASTCEEQCPDGEDCFDCQECVEICEEDRSDFEAGAGPVFSEDFQDDTFCTLSDDDQESKAIDECGLE